MTDTSEREKRDECSFCGNHHKSDREDCEVAKKAEELGAKVSWANNPDEFNHLMELTPDVLRAYVEHAKKAALDGGAVSQNEALTVAKLINPHAFGPKNEPHVLANYCDFEGTPLTAKEVAEIERLLTLARSIIAALRQPQPSRERDIELIKFVLEPRAYSISYTENGRMDDQSYGEIHAAFNASRGK